MIMYIVGKKDFSDFIPVNAGYQCCDPGYGYGPTVRDYYTIHYIEKGKGIYKSINGEHEVNAGEAFLIRPGEMAYYEADKENPWDYIWIGFKGKFSEKFYDLPDILKPDGTLFAEIKSLPETMLEERLCAIIFRLYCNLFENITEPDFVGKVMGVINAKYMDDIKISDIADELNLNRKYLSSLFKKKTGITMQEFLIRKRLTEGKKLLEKGYNVSEAAVLSGYKDAFGFSKAFSAFFGKSPKSLRKVTK